MPGEPSVSCPFLSQEGGTDACTEVSHASSVRGVASQMGQGLSARKIAQRLGISRPAVAEYVRRAQAAGLSWPIPATCDAGALERLLLPSAPARSPATHVEPEWAIVHRELKHKGGTLFLLWQE